MKLPNGYGTVKKISGTRRRPYLVRKIAGWRYDEAKDKTVQEYITIGYAATRKEVLQMLEEFNQNDQEDRRSQGCHVAH